MTSRETETHCVGSYSANKGSFKSPVLGANELRVSIKCKVNVIDINNISNKLIVRLIPLESFEL